MRTQGLHVVGACCKGPKRSYQPGYHVKGPHQTATQPFVADSRIRFGAADEKFLHLREHYAHLQP
jgi:hypothetical protein